MSIRQQSSRKAAIKARRSIAYQAALGRRKSLMPFEFNFVDERRSDTHLNEKMLKVSIIESENSTIEARTEDMIKTPDAGLARELNLTFEKISDDVFLPLVQNLPEKNSIEVANISNRTFDIGVEAVPDISLIEFHASVDKENQNSTKRDNIKLQKAISKEATKRIRVGRKNSFENKTKNAKTDVKTKKVTKNLKVNSKIAKTRKINVLQPKTTDNRTPAKIAANRTIAKASYSTPNAGKTPNRGNTPAKFDLLASLKKKPTWEMHKGAMKPLGQQCYTPEAVKMNKSKIQEKIQTGSSRTASIIGKKRTLK